MDIPPVANCLHLNKLVHYLFLKKRVSGIYLGVLAVVFVMVAVMLMLGVYVILVLAAVLASIGIAYLW